MLKHASLVMVFSDLLADPEPIISALRRLRHGGNDVILFHILDEAEVAFPFSGLVELEEPESNTRLEVDADSYRRDYLLEIEQFRETAAFRGWQLLGCAVMTNHAHLVVGVQGDPDPNRLLHDFKSYATRMLNKRWPRPASETWWTIDGSKRILRDEQAVQNAIDYVRQQYCPLATWFREADLTRP